MSCDRPAMHRLTLSWMQLVALSGQRERRMALRNSKPNGSINLSVSSGGRRTHYITDARMRVAWRGPRRNILDGWMAKEWDR